MSEKRWILEEYFEGYWHKVGFTDNPNKRLIEVSEKGHEMTIIQEDRKMPVSRTFVDVEEYYPPDKKCMICDVIIDGNYATIQGDKYVCNEHITWTNEPKEKEIINIGLCFGCGKPITSEVESFTHTKHVLYHNECYEKKEEDDDC